MKLFAGVVENLNITPEKFAEKIGKSVEEVVKLLHCAIPVDESMAEALGAQGYSTKRAWLAMQKNYDSYQTGKES